MSGVAPWVILLVAAAGLQRASANWQSVIEKVYARGIFPSIGHSLSLIFGLFPFSVAEIGLESASLLLAMWLIRTALRSPRWAGLTQAWPLISRRLTTVTAIVCLAYACFVLLWGLNYNRQPFAVIAGLRPPNPATIDDLQGLCENLVERANALRPEVDEGPDGVMTLTGGVRGTLQRAQIGYERASTVFPVLGGHFSPPKPVLISPLWAYTGIEGAYCPFTGEANVNTAVPPMSIPAGACHEMAHQRGFAREDEANYIAYLTCRLHPDPDFQYSGLILALTHSTAELRRRDAQRYAAVVECYDPGVKRDLAHAAAFWRAREGPLRRLSDRINDSYLKANNQSAGVLSYNRMVDLLLAEYLLNR